LNEQLEDQNKLTFGIIASFAARGYDVSYETPRSEGLALFHLGERKYDHLLFLPSKVKGMFV
jgi:oligosaccharyltransferase complex subunit beta